MLARSSSLIAAAALLVLAAVSAPLASEGHICLYEPRQRGAMVLDSPGDPSCSHKGPAPCGLGSAPAGSPVASYVAGSAVTVFFQQSLNHFFGKSPGNLRVQIAKGPNPQESDFNYEFGQTVADWNAMDEISFANVSVQGTMPNYACDECVLRLTYASQNPGENDTSMNFYQCADIAITGTALKIHEDSSLLFADDASAPSATVTVADEKDDSNGCCTIPQWEGQFYVAGAVPFAGPGFFSYDALNKLMFTSTSTDEFGTSYENHYQNFTSGMEWRFVEKDGVSTCSAYGLDEWNDYCYGAGQNEEFAGNMNVGGQMVSVFQNPSADFTWGVSQVSPSGDAQCIPVFRQHGLGHVLQMVFNVTSGIADPSIYAAPSSCHMNRAWELSQSHDLEAIRAFAKTLPRAPKSNAAGIKAHGISAPSKTTGKKQSKQSAKHEKKSGRQHHAKKAERQQHKVEGKAEKKLKQHIKKAKHSKKGQ